MYVRRSVHKVKAYARVSGMSAPTVTRRDLHINKKSATRSLPTCDTSRGQSSSKMIRRISEDAAVSASPLSGMPYNSQHYVKIT